MTLPGIYPLIVTHKQLNSCLCSLDHIVGPIKNEISNSQHCKATDMLHFLFSFCNTGGDAAHVEPNDRKLMAAFEKVQELANKPDTPLRTNLNLV